MVIVIRQVIWVAAGVVIWETSQVVIGEALEAVIREALDLDLVGMEQEFVLAVLIIYALLQQLLDSSWER